MRSKPPSEPVVLYEDGEIIVVDKPSGILTERPLAGDDASLEEVLQNLQKGRDRVFVVQRLDRPTSGVLVLAKTREANRALAKAMSTHAIGREYMAVVHGAFGADRADLDAPLRGRRALTHVEVIERHGGLATSLRCVLDTGRTHQIRLHTSRAGHAVLGDPRHGQRRAWDPPRLALHAVKLAFDHPRTGAPMTFNSPLPDDLSTWLADLRAIAAKSTKAAMT